MRRSIIVTPMLLALLIAGCAGGMAGGRHGRSAPYVWPAGSGTTYETVQVMGMNMEVPQMGGMTITTTSTVVFQVEPADAARTFQVSVIDARVEMDSPMPTGGEEAMNVKALIGLVSTVTLDETGLITGATELEGNAGVGAMGVEAFKETLQTFFLVLPPEGMAVGREWSRESTYSTNQSGMQMAFRNTAGYHCVGETVFEGVAAWEVAETGKTSLVGGADMGGASVDVDASGDGTGTILVEKQTMRLLKYEGKGVLRGSLGAQGMSIPLNISQATAVNIKK
jgi:hypothetical protein